MEPVCDTDALMLRVNDLLLEVENVAEFDLECESEYEALLELDMLEEVV